MYPSPEAREVGILLRISRELDVCGDITATVDSPSELIAWAGVLKDPRVLAWRPQDSGSRFVQVSADHRRAPVRGHVSAVLSCEQHAHFWDALHLEDLEPGGTRSLTVADLTAAWETMPLTPPEDPVTPDPPPSTDRAACLGAAPSSTAATRFVNPVRRQPVNHQIRPNRPDRPSKSNPRMKGVHRDVATQH